MSERYLFLLSPYTLPTDHPLMLADADMAAWLNGYLALWHPAALAGASEPPKAVSQYEHEQPKAHHIYALPDSPPLYLADDWSGRATNAEACAFTATQEREGTLTALHQSLASFQSSAEQSSRLELPAEIVRPFLAIGFGYLMIEHLFDSMQHERVLAQGDFWQEVQKAATALATPQPQSFRDHLQKAANLLQSAREILYPVGIHLLDIVLPDERKLGTTMPKTFSGSHPLNLIASGGTLERIREEFPNRFEELRQRISDSGGTPALEICLGAYRERADTVLPAESQLWSMRQGPATARELLNAEVRVFGRRRSAFHPQLPLFLHATGYEKGILLSFDGAVVPTHRSPIVNWSSADGKQLDVFCRTPQPAHQASTFFNLVHSLHETIMQDTAATFALLHSEGQPSPCYHDWLELNELAQVLGKWTTFSRYFSDVTAGEYAPAATVDEFFSDYLEDRTTQKLPDAVSAFPIHWRQRRTLDSAWTYLAIQRGLGGGQAEAMEKLHNDLATIEKRFESTTGQALPELAAFEEHAARLLAERLQVRAAGNTPGFMLLNPCSFIRRMSLELDGVAGPLPVEGPIKAAQFDGNHARLVVEVPALGFAWIPRSSSGAPPPKARMKMADANTIRNEFLEAEVDTTSGGLRALRDPRTRSNRLGQQLVFNPGSVMKARQVRVTSSGPAMAEIVSDGSLWNEQNELLATFRQRFRLWLGRPILEMRIEIQPAKPIEGYPWHAYYGSRFAWRDERTVLLRGVNSTSHVSNHTRPVSPEFLELQSGSDRTTIFPCGLPFHQRHGTRMVDVILIPEAETGTVFDLALGVEREFPAQTALGLCTPATVLPTEKGPPHIGPSGWLFHLDAPNLMLTSFRPLPQTAAAVLASLLESSGFAGSAEMRCARNPSRAMLIDAAGNTTVEVPVFNDAVSLDVAANDLLRLKLEWT
ncbi:MAG TPA: hypothetical protein VGZ47_23395 [Gemmataceae bacterium]|jgi:hypothetical protein|nr:hypothetical protein [Gemmataceae bacterium]